MPRTTTKKAFKIRRKSDRKFLEANMYLWSKEGTIWARKPSFAQSWGIRRAFEDYECEIVEYRVSYLEVGTTSYQKEQ